MNSAMNCIGRTSGALLGGFYMANGALWGRREGYALYTLTAVISGGVLLAHAVVSLLLRLCGQPAMLAPTANGQREPAPPARTAPMHVAPCDTPWQVHTRTAREDSVDAGAYVSAQ